MINFLLKSTNILALFLVLSVILIEKANADEFKIIPSIAVKEEYNDNIFLLNNDEALVDDYITTLSPGIQIDERTERLIARLQSRLDFLIYKDNNDLDTVDQFHKGNFQYRLTPRMDIAVEAGYVRDSRRDRDIEQTGLVIFSNAERNQQRYKVRAEYDISEKSTSEIGYNYNQDEYDDEELVDFKSHEVGLLYTHNMNDFISQTEGRVNLGYTLYNFTETLTDLEVDNYSLTMGVEHKFSETFSLIADIGTRYSSSSKFNSSIDSEEWAPIGDISLTYDGEFATFSAVIFKDLKPRSGGRGTVDRTAFIFDGYRKLTEELSIGLAAEYFLNKEGPGDLTIDDNTISIRPKLRYDFTKNLFLEVVYSYTFTDEKDNNLERERNLVFLRLRIQYPFLE